MTDEEILDAISKVDGLGGMTGNERHYLSGLMKEFEEAMVNDKEKARRILRWLKFDEPSVNKIVI